MLTQPASASPRAPEQKVQVGQRVRRRQTGGGEAAGYHADGPKQGAPNSRTSRFRTAGVTDVQVTEIAETVASFLRDVQHSAPPGRWQTLGDGGVTPPGT